MPISDMKRQTPVKPTKIADHKGKKPSKYNKNIEMNHILMSFNIPKNS